MYNDISKTILTKKTILIPGIIGAAIAIAFVVFLVVEKTPESTVTKNQSSNSGIRVNTYKDKSGLWGYDVYRSGKLFIHQPHIPVVSGNRGFTTEHDAQKVAELVVNKIKKNILPPSLTIQEMKDVGIVVE